MLRVGIIDYINTLPLFHALRQNIISHNATFSFGVPSQINKLFSKNKLDVATISAAHFLEYRLEYTLLSDLGIAATKQVMSILLFTKKKPHELDGATIFLPSHSASSIRILKMICKHFWKITPRFCTFVGSTEYLFQQDNPFLVIGTECLLLFEKYPDYPSLDLAQVWYNFTNKASIYCLIATRNDSFISKQQEVIEFHKYLNKSYEWGQNNMNEIITHAVLETGCSRPLIEKYFLTLEYELSPKHFSGLDYLATL
jgi:chorismate dehydratase